MAQNYLLRISVYPYVRKYLSFYYPEPMAVSDRGYPTALLLSMLEKGVKVDPSMIIRSHKLNLGAHFGVSVGYVTSIKKGKHLTNDKVTLFNEAMGDLIREEMYRYVRYRLAENKHADDAIREFMTLYNFSEDELPFENLKRYYYRERARIEARRQKNATVEPQFVLTF